MARWGEADSDPLADIAAWRKTIAAQEMRPNAIVMPTQRWRRIERIIARRTLSKRAYRRWRGRQSIARRAYHDKLVRLQRRP